MSCAIELANGQTQYLPGAPIQGTLRWDFHRVPAEAVLRLYWYTQGRGDRDVGLGYEVDVLHREPRYEGPFSIDAPNGPYSFSGKLITLRWSLELSLERGNELAQADLVISPWAQEIALGHVD